MPEFSYAKTIKQKDLRCRKELFEPRNKLGNDLYSKNFQNNQLEIKKEKTRREKKTAATQFEPVVYSY